MDAVALVAVMMLVGGVGLAQVLGLLGVAYDRATGRQLTVIPARDMAGAHGRGGRRRWSWVLSWSSGG